MVIQAVRNGDRLDFQSDGKNVDSGIDEGQKGKKTGIKIAKWYNKALGGLFGISKATKLRLSNGKEVQVVSNSLGKYLERTTKGGGTADCKKSLLERKHQTVHKAFLGSLDDIEAEQKPKAIGLLLECHITHWAQKDKEIDLSGIFTVENNQDERQQAAVLEKFEEKWSNLFLDEFAEVENQLPKASITREEANGIAGQVKTDLRTAFASEDPNIVPNWNARLKTQYENPTEWEGKKYASQFHSDLIQRTPFSRIIIAEKSVERAKVDQEHAETATEEQRKIVETVCNEIDQLVKEGFQDQENWKYALQFFVSQPLHAVTADISTVAIMAGSPYGVTSNSRDIDDAREIKVVKGEGKKVTISATRETVVTANEEDIEGSKMKFVTTVVLEEVDGIPQVTSFDIKMT